MIFSLPLALPIPALPPADDLGVGIRNNLYAPSWGLDQHVFHDISSGDVDGNHALDVVLLGTAAGGVERLVCMQDVSDWIRPQTLSTQATAFCLLPDGGAQGNGVLGATSTGLVMYTPAADGLRPTAVSNSQSFTGCTDLAAVNIGGSVCVAGITEASGLVRGHLAATQFVSGGTTTVADVTSIAAVEWQPGVPGVASLSNGFVKVHDIITGTELYSAAYAGTTGVLEVSGSRVLVGFLDSSGIWTAVQVHEAGQPVVDTLLSPIQLPITDLDVADMDGDGLEDLLVTMGSGLRQTWILYGQSTGPIPFNFQPGSPMVIDFDDLDFSTHPVTAAGDADGDGDTDFLRIADTEFGPEFQVRRGEVASHKALRPTLTSTDIGTYYKTTGLLQINWVDEIDIANWDSDYPNATHIEMDLWIQSTSTATFDPTPNATFTIPIAPLQSATGMFVNHQVGLGHGSAIFNFRIRYMAGADPVGPPYHFNLAHDQGVQEAITFVDNWSLLSEIEDAEEDGTNNAGQTNERGSTSPPVPPPGT